MESGPRSTQMGTPSVTNASTLLETLSTDALSIIVKRICSRLHRSLTLPYLESFHETPRELETVHFLGLLFSENSPFRAAAGTLVSQIELHWPYPKTPIHSSMRVLNIGRELFEGQAEEMDLGKSMFTACGPYVRKIVVPDVCEETEDAKHFMEQFMSYAFKYCRNVEEISFSRYRAPLTKWGTASSFFREYAANLRTIKWDGEEDEDGFPDLRKCVNVKCLKSRDLNSAALVSLLKASGATLEELYVSISPVGDSLEVIEAIKNHCKQLSVIHLENLEDVMDVIDQETYCSLLCSFGSQLKSAETDGLGHEHLGDVANACSNLEASVYWTYKASTDWQQVYSLGPRLASLSLNVDLLCGAEYSRALEQCSNLRELNISSHYMGKRRKVTDEMIGAVFVPARFPKLEHLSIKNFRSSERNMGLIASCTANLKSAGLFPSETDSRVTGFQVIADSNRHLKEIRVAIFLFSAADRKAKSALEWVSGLVKVFRKCRNVQIGVLCSDEGGAKKEDLIRICKVLPCRDVDVSVCIGDVRYQYPEETA